MNKVPQLVHTRKNRYSSVVYVASMIDVAISNLKLRIFYPHRVGCRIYVQSTLIYVSRSLYFILSLDQQYSHLLASLPIWHILCSFPCVVSGSLYLPQSDDAEGISIQPIPIHIEFVYLLYTNRCFHFRRLTFFCISQKLLSSDLNRCWISISDLRIMGDSFEIYSVISPSRHFVF